MDYFKEEFLSILNLKEKDLKMKLSSFISNQRILEEMKKIEKHFFIVFDFQDLAMFINSTVEEIIEFCRRKFYAGTIWK